MVIQHFPFLPTYRVFDHAVFYINNVSQFVVRWRCWPNMQHAIYELVLKASYRIPRAMCSPGGVARLSKRGFLAAVWRERWGYVPMPCPQQRRIPSIIRAVSPCFTPPCIARDKERERERGVGHRCPPFQLRATTALLLTRPPISPYPRANSPFLYDVLSPWRFGGQCRPTITRPYLLYYIYVVACGREGLCGVSTLSRAAPFFLLCFSLPLFYTHTFPIWNYSASRAELGYVTNSSTIIDKVIL